MPMLCVPTGPGGIPLAITPFYVTANSCPSGSASFTAPGNLIGSNNIVGQTGQQAATSQLPQLGTFFDLINNPSTWKHLGILIAGFTLLVVGVIVFAVDPDAGDVKKAGGALTPESKPPPPPPKPEYRTISHTQVRHQQGKIVSRTTTRHREKI